MSRIVASLSLLCLFALAAPLADASAPAPEQAPPPDAPAATSMGQARIGGVVTHVDSDEAIEGALVILQCSCLPEALEGFTNERGIYMFTQLPAGAYTLQVLYDSTDATKMIELASEDDLRANFSLAREELVREIVVESVASASMGRALMPLSGSAGASPARSGVLTAGTLDDNTSNELEAFAQTSFAGDTQLEPLGLGPRTQVRVVDSREQPISGAQLSFDDGRGKRRSLRTGTDGRAVIDGATDLGRKPGVIAEGASLRVSVSHERVSRVVDLRLGGAAVQVKLPFTQSSRRKVPRITGLDLLLVVDTTGSMSDELDWLSAELREVVAQTLRAHRGVDARLGVLSYRDEGDEYVTRRFEFSADHDAFQTHLAAQRADGGGDTPEAVHLALEQAASFAWRQDPHTAKVILFVADAPPHLADIPASLTATLALREAGVSIYPVASSGVDDLAELLFRVLAVDSGAQYLFLTDDSGVGNAHAPPHATDYGVELLRDALLRVLAAELAGEQAPLPTRQAKAAFALQRSMFDDAGMHLLHGGPRVHLSLP